MPGQGDMLGIRQARLRFTMNGETRCKPSRLRHGTNSVLHWNQWISGSQILFIQRARLCSKYREGNRSPRARTENAAPHVRYTMIRVRYTRSIIYLSLCSWQSVITGVIALGSFNKPAKQRTPRKMRYTPPLRTIVCLGRALTLRPKPLSSLDMYVSTIRGVERFITSVAFRGEDSRFPPRRLSYATHALLLFTYLSGKH